jgi:hypothetical protein
VAVRDESNALPICPAFELPEQAASEGWLVEGLWSQLAVGFIAGHPKCGKSWLALDLAISVASGTDCLGRFAVHQAGPTLAYLAEDPLPRVRERIASLCAHKGIALSGLALNIITAPCLLLDREEDRDSLDEALGRLKPRLLVLDPLIRLHGLDENSSTEVSNLLGFLRLLSRKHALSIVVVHHMSKKSRRQLGQALRGSSDLHAWSDSSAYLTRQKDHVLLTLEHRSAPAPEPLALTLAAGRDGKTPHLEPLAPSAASPVPAPVQTPAPDSPPDALADSVCSLLRTEGQPLSRVALRARLGVNNSRLGDVLVSLEQAGRLCRSRDGWTVAVPAAASAISEAGGATRLGLSLPATSEVG